MAINREREERKTHKKIANKTHHFQLKKTHVYICKRPLVGKARKKDS